MVKSTCAVAELDLSCMSSLEAGLLTTTLYSLHIHHEEEIRKKMNFLRLCGDRQVTKDALKKLVLMRQ